MRVRSLAILMLLLLSAVDAHADPASLPDAAARKAAVKCQKAIDAAGTKLVATKLKSLDACSTAVLACIQTKPADAACLSKATGKCSKSLLTAIPQAEVAATAKIVKSCGAPLRPADLLAPDGLGIGAQAAACNTDFGLNVCSDLPTLASCLVAEGSRGAERLFASEQPRANELIQQVITPLPLAHLPAFPGCQDCAQAPSDTLGKAVAVCGGTLTKAGRTFAGAVAKGLGGCIDKVSACIQSKPGDAKCLGKAATACDAAVAKLAAARTKLGATVDKKCADTGLLPFATLAAAAALNLDALADDCAALGVGPLASLDDYIACVRRQHECSVADALRATLPRTAELVDLDALGAAGAVLDPAACPASLPSTALAVRRAHPRLAFFSISKFFSLVKRTGIGAGVKATPFSSTLPASSPGAPKRVTFPLGTWSRFVPGTSRLMKMPYHLGGRARAARAADAAPPTLIVGVQRIDIGVEDHFEIPLDAVDANGDGEVELEIQYDAAPPSCVFDLAVAVDDGGEVSDYTDVEQVADTVPPATVTATPVPTATPITTTTTTPTSAATATPNATATGAGGATATATAGGGTPIPTTTPSPGPAFAYALTTTDDTVAPGGTASLTLTVTNLSNAPQNATLSFTVPNFTTYAGFGAGAVRNVAFTNVAAGTSQSVLVPLVVTNGAGAPPDGTLVTVTFNDVARGAQVTRTVATNAAPAARLTVSTADATVAPNGTITYTFGFANVGIGPIAGADLVATLPVGTSFVAAEGGVVPDVDGTVHWPLGTLGGNTAGQRILTIAAQANARGPLVVAAELRDGGAQSLAHASFATVVHANPTFAYTLTSIDDAVGPGRTALFRVTVTNLTNAAQAATLAFRVPDFTTYAGFGAGTVRSVGFSAVAAGGSQSALLPFVAVSGSGAPPDGTIVDLALHDTARGAALARALVSDASPSAALALTTAADSVAANEEFTYMLAFDNPAIAPLTATELDVRVPTGASFVRADGGVTPDADGVVRWQLGTLAGNASGIRTVTFAAPASPHTPLLVEAALRNAATGEVVTQASAATAVYTTPAFAYTLTTIDDAVAPGGTTIFRVTATNLTNATQDATLSFRVPDFTSYAGFGPGAVRGVALNGVPAGGSQSALLPLVVTSGAAAPPDGTVIALAVDDTARGIAVSRPVVARSAPVVELAIATTRATVAPTGTLSYTLAFDNPRSTSLSTVELGVRVPAGATFVSADEDVVPDANGIVRFPIGTLAGNAGGQRTVTFAATAGARAPLLVEADVHDGGTHEVLTQASAATAIYAAPVFAYTLTTTDDDPIVPGRSAAYLVTVTNLTNAPQNAVLAFRVPDFTSYAGFGAGAVRSVSFSNVLAGESQTAAVPLVVTNGAAAPPDGTVIALAVDDTARGAVVARTIVTRAAPRAEIKVATPQSLAVPSGPLTYTVYFHNRQASELLGAELAIPVPAGATFSSADGGVTPDADGVVRFPLGTLASGAGGNRTVDFTVDATTTAPLLVDATLTDAGGEILAQASAASSVTTSPTFVYTLTTESDTVSAGQQITFTLTVTNATNATLNAAVSFRVPDYTTFNGFGAGTIRPIAINGVAPGATVPSQIVLTVPNGAGAPPVGTLVDLTVTDGDHGASVGHVITVN